MQEHDVDWAALAARVQQRRAELVAQRAAMTGAARRRDARDAADAMAKCRRSFAVLAHRAGDHADARRLLLLAAPPVPRQARPRGAGRPRERRAGASSRTSSQDPGDSDLPPRALALARPARTVYAFGCLSPAERGEVTERAAQS